MDLIVLAGDRGPGDPLAERSAVAGKTLVPVVGKPMLVRVLDTLGAWPKTDRIVVVAPDMRDYEQAIGLSSAAGRCLHVPPEASPSLSVGRALTELGSDRPVTLVTADHPLLSSRWLDALNGPGDEDLRVGLVDHALVRERFPHSRRTRYKFSDREVGGTNLFQFRTRQADQIIGLWRGVEQQRKRPWKVVSLLGPANLGLYLVGALALDQAFARLSKRLSVRIAYRLIDDPLSAVDIDTLSDLALVESLLADRAERDEGTACA